MRPTLQLANGALQKSNIELAGAIDRESKSNLALRQANARAESRFALAMEAIQVFHSGVSTDLLLKQEEFGDLRTRLLRGAKVFYDKLETLLKDQSRRKLANGGLPRSLCTSSAALPARSARQTRPLPSYSASHLASGQVSWPGQLWSRAASKA